VLLLNDGTKSIASPPPAFLVLLGGLAEELKPAIKTAAFPWLGYSGDDACAGERAADPLHWPRIDAKPAAILRTPGRPGVAEGLTDSFCSAEAIGRPPVAFSLIPDSRKPGTDSFGSNASQSFQNPLKRSGAKAV
jgi:hypothetical protein